MHALGFAQPLLVVVHLKEVDEEGCSQQAGAAEQAAQLPSRHSADALTQYKRHRHQSYPQVSREHPSKSP
jgi:hypothetical protein